AFLEDTMKEAPVKKASPPSRRLKLEVFQNTSWKPRIQFKAKGPEAFLRAMSMVGSISSLHSAGLPLRVVGWRTPCSRRRVRFARFLENPAHNSWKGVQP